MVCSLMDLLGIGQRVTFQLPAMDTPVTPAPNHQMFEVLVPEGVRPGQPFALIAQGQRVMVTCPPNVSPGQKIRFQLPVVLNEQELSAIQVSYDKDGWMRCLGQDMKFHWVYQSSATNTTQPSLAMPKYNFQPDRTAFVRNLIKSDDGAVTGIEFMPATEYCIASTVKGTSINYQEISNISRLPFQQKVDWLKNQFTSLRVPWEEGHMKIRVRRDELLEDAITAFMNLDEEDFMKMYRFEFIGKFQLFRVSHRLPFVVPVVYCTYPHISLVFVSTVASSSTLLLVSVIPNRHSSR